MTERVDLSEVRRLLAAASDRCSQLDGTPIPSQDNRRDRQAAVAEVQRLTLFLAHLLDTARARTMDEYHLVRGFTDHLPNEEHS